MITTATMRWEEHHHGYRLTVRRGPEGQRGTQLWHGDSLSLPGVAEVLKAKNCPVENVEILADQA
jgi:hypothetical protein